jgi:predicted transcriptional regulator
MARTPQPVTDAELSILKVLWELKHATVPELTERIYAEETLATKATVQKLLGRLEAKDCVQRDRKTWPHQFSATVERDVLIARQLQSTAAKLCHGELHPLLTSLVKASDLSAEDRMSLRGLLDELDRADK